MKTKSLFIVILLLVLSQLSYSQTQEEEMASARTFFDNARQNEQEGKIDDALSNYLEASIIYKKYEVWKNHLICEFSATNLMNYNADYDNSLKHLLDIEEKSAEIFGDTSNFVAAVYHSIGQVYFQKGELDNSIYYFDKAITLKSVLFGENSVEVAHIYNSIANVYTKIGEYDLALNYYNESLLITKSLLGEKHPENALAYTNIANIYSGRGEYDKAIEYKQIVIDLMLENYGENNEEVANAYSGIGNAYIDKKEYETAKEYILKSIEIKKIIYGENHLNVADDYVNIGVIFMKEDNLDYSIQYYFMALEIYKSYLGENHPEVAAVYNNIGIVCEKQGRYYQAAEYYEIALKIRRDNFGDINPEIASIYTNIGSMYFNQSEDEKAIKNFDKAISINQNIFGNHHPNLVEPFLNIANIYYQKNNHEKALENYQYALISNVSNFESFDYQINPPVSKFYDSFRFLRTLHGKGRAFYLKYENEGNIINLEFALKSFLACDSLVTIMRKTTTSEKDKIALGEITAEIYEHAITTCMAINSKTKSNKYNELAFYFSERNKSGTLLQAIAASKAKQFSGIPDTLLDKEKTLRMQITYYEEQLAKLSDFEKEPFYRDKLFEYNKKYVELISFFEQNYPKYYKMKYNTKSVTISDLQTMIGDNTAILDYFIGEDGIYLYVITKKDFNIYKTQKSENFYENIEVFNNVILSYYPEDVQAYQDLAYLLYQQLIPVDFPKKINKLIIIPDGEIGTISFDALFSEEYKGELKKYVDFPFLIKKYNISYNYSANLFYSIFNDKSQYAQNRPSKDWFGIAPVFQADNQLFFNNNLVQTIEGTELEVNSIQKNFQDRNYIADTRLNKFANETEFKQKIDLKNYKILHIATHGIVNSDMPELSAILLAHDQNSENDGILYAGEIYNLELNSDIVVLSACETALGKISKGEGVIGLSRAIMYAGSRNMVLSLWKVSDKVTTQVMIKFYDNILEENKNFDNMPEFSNALYTAKLQIIEEGKYAHPFFWSSFILIGN